MRRALTWLLTLAVVVAAMAVWHEGGPAPADGGVALFSEAQRGITLVIPAAPLPEERRAAEQMRSTLAKASGLTPRHFPIRQEGGPTPRRALWIGATHHGRGFLPRGARPPFDTAIGFRVQAGMAWVRSERRESIEAAVGWFLERHLGARWFMPGPLGEHVPRVSRRVLVAGEEVVRPGFVSRDLGVSGAEAREWYARNRLGTRFEHGHNLTTVFPAEDLRRVPEMAPMRQGRRYIPAGPGDIYWQPNLLSPAAVEHAAAAAMRAFDADPARLSYSLSTNDAFRYDDSHETLAAVAPARFFRHRPDYSDLVFRFTNAVADRVAARHPNRYLPAYAYYWCESAPGFPIARNVVPFLTADRSQWRHPEFAAEDRALIERWTRSGAEIVGVYDYFYGAPFLSPRPTLYAVRETIPFHHRAGVRAFYAEMNPNWALDGPKPWLAAQLLWSPESDPEKLLDLYYREFWAEAAEPMQAFFARCDGVWREQPTPPLWLRYYQDEDQAWIYSPAQRAALRGHLEEAARAARSEIVRARVAFAAAGFEVTEAYGDFWDARRQLSLLARPGGEPGVLLGAWTNYRNARERFTATYARLRQAHPLAVASQNLEIYLRNEPDSRAARELLRSPEGKARLQETGLAAQFVDAAPEEIERLLDGGTEQLRDPGWRDLRVLSVGSSAAVDWTEPGAAWIAHGEPWEGRTVEMRDGMNGGRVLRIAGCRTEQIFQWTTATGGTLYAARVNVRAKSSPGTAAFLIVNFLDEKQQHIGLGRVDRVPLDDAARDWELCVLARAPAQARYVGVSLRVMNQIGDDFAEFSGVSLRRLAE